MNQRWRDGRDSYRPAGEPIRTSDYEVAAIAGDAAPKAFVLAHHYSGTFPAARFRFGLYRRGELAGVAVFSQPVRDEVLLNVFPTGCAQDSVELGRFVLLDQVPANGETWFLARCFELLRGDLVGVVSFSDPMPRRSSAGVVVFPGHVGTIYQAFNGAYLGRATARTLRLLADGRVLSARALQKVRTRERGWAYVVEQLVAAGAPRPRPDQLQDLRPWLSAVLPLVSRTVRHPGNYRYAWALERSARRFLEARREAYPKLRAAA